VLSPPPLTSCPASSSLSSVILVHAPAAEIKDLAPNSLIRLQLWDIAGQERFGNMTRVYYKEAHGAFIVFDVTRDETFDLAQRWKNDIDNKVTLPNGDPIPVVLLANKVPPPGGYLTFHTSSHNPFRS